MKKLASTILSLLLLILLSHCSKETAPTESQANSETFRGASGSLAQLKLALETIKATVESSSFSSLSEEEQSVQIKKILEPFSFDLESTKQYTFQAIESSKPKLSPEKYQELLETWRSLFPDSSRNLTQRQALNLGGTGGVSFLFNALNNFHSANLQTLLTLLNQFLASITQLTQDISQITDQLANASPPPTNGLKRLFGPTACPTVTSKYPSGFVMEGNPCDHFAELKTCMQFEKEKKCLARCDGLDPTVWTCNANAREVKEVICKTTTDPTYLIMCLGLQGSEDAFCTRANGDGGQFPIGFYVCANDAAHLKGTTSKN